MNIFDRHRIKLEKNKQLNKAMRIKARDRADRRAAARGRDRYIQSKLAVLRS